MNASTTGARGCDRNPLPAVMGRVCYHPCETGCNRQALDTAVGIHVVERFLGDLATERNWPMPAAKAASGKRVLEAGLPRTAHNGRRIGANRSPLRSVMGFEDTLEPIKN